MGVRANPRISVHILLLFLLLAIVIPVAQVAWGRYWAHKEAIPKARALAESGEWTSAYEVASAAAEHLRADDHELTRLWPMLSREITIVSDPVGAEVFWRPYADQALRWQRLGRTPLHNVRVEAGTVRLRLAKSGYSDLEIAAASSKYDLRLEAIGPHPVMVYIPAGPLFAHYSGLGKLGPLMVDDFWVDRNEVSNWEFQKFVNAGGYRNRRYWRIPFREKGRGLSWDEGMARLIDRTGRPAPAGWNRAVYPPGQADYPVSGVSLYEAAAYAEFAGKTLPSVYEWFRAAGGEESASMVAVSNYACRGLLPVGSTGAVGRFGAYDMAGNVREWCFNESDGLNFILGGAWSDPSYIFVRGEKLDPFNRSALNGFRCIKPSQRSNRSRLLGSIPAPALDEGIPVTPSVEVFTISSRLYEHEKTNLQPIVESMKQSQNWRHEILRFPNGSGKDQLIAHLFLPVAKRPPYQCIIYVPSGAAVQAESSAGIQPEEYILRSGRAMLYPIFWGTYDRSSGLPSDPENSGYPPPMFIREALINWKKETSISLDYLQRRADIGKIGYLGVSAGANFGPVLLSGETRFRAAVFLSGFV